MDIKRGSIEALGSCSICDKGELSITGNNLVYPYKNVFEIKGRFSATVICDDCFDRLIETRDFIISKEIADKLSNY